MKQTVLAIVGPTASGKTTISIALAKAFSGEILSGDSMQVYRGMDIGTAKISDDEMEGIPHHLIDMCNPDTAFTVREYQQLAVQKIAEIHQREKLPIIVGGTGMYIEAVTHGYQMPPSKKDTAFRLALEKLAQEQGNEVLHQRLQQVDAVSAKRLHPNDLRRVIRAIEVTQQTGRPFSEQAQKQKTRYEQIIWIGLTMPRDLLYERINQRVDQMMEQGLLDEVKKLQKRGFHAGMTAMQAIGYKELFQVLEGNVPLEIAVDQIKQGSRKYAKRQLSWFRRNERVRWFDTSEINALQEIQQWIAGEIIVNRE